MGSIEQPSSGSPLVENCLPCLEVSTLLSRTLRVHRNIKVIDKLRELSHIGSRPSRRRAEGIHLVPPMTTGPFSALGSDLPTLISIHNG